MKQFFGTALIFLASVTVRAQNDGIIIPFDEQRNAFAVAQCSDGAGHTYVLGYVSCYKPGTGLYLHGCPNGAIVVKLNSAGKILWQHRFYSPSNFYPDGFQNAGDRLLVVGWGEDPAGYCQSFCTGPCPNLPAVLSLDAATGTPLSTRVFTEDIPCYRHGIAASTVLRDGAFALLQHRASGGPLTLDFRDGNFSRQAILPTNDTVFSSGFAAAFDEDAQTFLVAKEDSLRVYNAAVEQVRALPMPPTSDYPALFAATIAASRTHYALCLPEYLETDGNPYTGHDSAVGLLTIWEKSGRLVHTGRTDAFDKLVFADDGRLWGMVRNAGGSSLSEGAKRIHLMEMDLNGKRQRDGLIGGPWILGSDFSVSGGVITLTGTSATDYHGFANEPDTPSRMWFHRMPVTDIPVVFSERSAACSDMLVAPNPAADYFTLSTTDLLAARSSWVVMRDAVGRVISSSTWDGNALLLPVADAAARLYFITVRKADRVCAYKAVKQ